MSSAPTMLISKMGSVADIKGASNKQGAHVISWAAHGAPNQKWKIEASGTVGYYLIRSVANNMVMDVQGANKARGTNIHMWEQNGTDAQLWKFEDAGSGFYAIKSKLNDMALDICGEKKDGGNLITWPFAGAVNDLWKLEAGVKLPAPDAAPPKPAPVVAAGGAGSSGVLARGSGEALLKAGGVVAALGMGALAVVSAPVSVPVGVGLLTAGVVGIGAAPIASLMEKK